MPNCSGLETFLHFHVGDRPPAHLQRLTGQPSGNPNHLSLISADLDARNRSPEPRLSCRRHPPFICLWIEANVKGDAAAVKTLVQQGSFSPSHPPTCSLSYSATCRSEIEPDLRKSSMPKHRPDPGSSLSKSSPDPTTSRAGNLFGVLEGWFLRLSFVDKVRHDSFVCYSTLPSCRRQNLGHLGQRRIEQGIPNPAIPLQKTSSRLNAPRQAKAHPPAPLTPPIEILAHQI